VPRKGKVYLLLMEEREKVHKFILEQLRKGYIRLSKSPQTALVFFIGKKNDKKYITIGILMNGLLKMIILCLSYQIL